MATNSENKAFLIGNGINRANSNGVKSWKELLEDLSQSFSVKIDLTNDLKPFPLSFEEILFRSKGMFDNKIREIKERIAEYFRLTPKNELHELFVKSGITNILTTNYDYAFEKVLIDDFNNDKKDTARSTEETLNSIKRRTIFKDSNLSVWHIHGEINQRLYPSKKVSTANSIMIGYEHYGKYFYEIQSYISGKKYENEMSILDKARDRNYSPKSWIDFFFMGELHIAGLSFDFSEYHLWWLLNFRAKQIKQERLKSPSKIYYYHSIMPEVDESERGKFVNQVIKRKMNQAKSDLFKALGIEIIPIQIRLNDYRGFYQQVYNRALK